MFTEMLIEIATMYWLIVVALVLSFILTIWLLDRCRITLHIKRIVLRIKIALCDIAIWFIKKKHKMKVYRLRRNNIYTTHIDRTYGRNIMREKHNTYRRRLVTSWFICGIVGVIIGVVSTMVVYGF